MSLPLWPMRMNTLLNNKEYGGTHTLVVLATWETKSEDSKVKDSLGYRASSRPKWLLS